ncbi:hypothetical protein DIPPA_59764, partial [Diplonema papillatum]
MVAALLVVVLLALFPAATAVAPLSSTKVKLEMATGAATVSVYVVSRTQTYPIAQKKSRFTYTEEVDVSGLIPSDFVYLGVEKLYGSAGPLSSFRFEVQRSDGLFYPLFCPDAYSVNASINSLDKETLHLEFFDLYEPRPLSYTVRTRWSTGNASQHNSTDIFVVFLHSEDSVYLAGIVTNPTENTTVEVATDSCPFPAVDVHNVSVRALEHHKDEWYIKEALLFVDNEWHLLWGTTWDSEQGSVVANDTALYEPFFIVPDTNFSFVQRSHLPATIGPATTAPATTAPDTTAPATRAPDSTAPDTTAPVTSAPLFSTKVKIE